MINITTNSDIFLTKLTGGVKICFGCLGKCAANAVY